ncbi:transmembrane protein 164 isoform X2 [Thrips palmi]|uniref:Transmembrane protein 164 isoform X2 n=1 Tax=Thrips palmi TaxID=161013 RepID=A0A6P8Y3C1_THRPL|nr:transmembrane protein 164 isoform X2 [Thrips palmi]
MRKMLEFTYKGVNLSVPSTGGPECANYLPVQRRIWETIFGVAFAGLLIWIGWKNLSPVVKPSPLQWRDRWGRNILLMSMCLVIGCEVGFKLQAQSTIFLLNPCHVTTAIQIYLLVGQPSKLLTSAFRIHLNFLNGPILATVFPETLSRQLPCELFVYWAQHGLMVIAPFYMLRLGGVYNMEPLSDLSWCIFSYGLLIMYHFVILQGLGLPSEINLNKMLCPASKDPFSGPNYRIWGTLHQMLLCPLACKLFIVGANYFLTQCNATKIKQHLHDELPPPASPEKNKKGSHGD